MKTIAVAIVCKTPEPGQSKTRLAPPLRPEECAAISACFIRDLARTIGELTQDGDVSGDVTADMTADVTGYALYTPLGSEMFLRSLLPQDFRLLPQHEGDFGARLMHGARELLQTHAGVILVNSDSPTLPRAILRAAVDALQSALQSSESRASVVLSPAHDGGYTLIGLTQLHARLFEEMPWSTADVHRLTVERAASLGLAVVNVPGWYDVDDAASLRLLEDEFAGQRLPFADISMTGADAPATRQFLSRRSERQTRPGQFILPASENPYVSVIIPCLNEAEAIGAVVREVLAEGVDEVIVVDNGSTDSTAERAAAAGARVVTQAVPGYGRACATGLAAVSAACEIVCFLDGDGSDVAAFLPQIVGPVAAGTADFVMGSRLRGQREKGSMTPQQRVAGWIAGQLLRLVYGVHYTDMSPFRAARVQPLRALGMSELTYGWNLEMQMRVAAAGWRILEIPVDHRCRRGGVSKVSGDLVAGIKAAWKITATFIRLSTSLKDQAAPRGVNP